MGLKIFIIGPAYPLRGGLATFDELMCSAFIKAGYDCSIISYSMLYPNFLFPGTSQYEKPNPLNPPSYSFKIYNLINTLNPISWVKTYLFIKKQKADFVVFRFWIPFLSPSLGTIARLLNKSKIATLVITDNIYPHEKRLGDKALVKYFIKNIKGFITMSNAVMQDLNTITNLKTKIQLLHPLYTSFGDKISKQEAREKLQLIQSEQIVLFFGIIRQYKGLDLLIDAFNNLKQHTNIKLLVVGECYHDINIYKNQIKQLQLEQTVTIIDKFISTDEVKYYFSATNLLALPYKSATQSGVTQIAFHFETPTLVTNVGGLKEVIPHNKAGYVVSPNSKEISDAILDYFHNNKELEFIKEMHKEKQKYSWDIFVNEVLNLYFQVKKIDDF